MRNYECKVCNGICDPGELIGDICIECREKEGKEQVNENGNVRSISKKGRYDGGNPRIYGRGLLPG